MKGRSAACAAARMASSAEAKPLKLAGSAAFVGGAGFAGGTARCVGAAPVRGDACVVGLDGPRPGARAPGVVRQDLGAKEARGCSPAARNGALGTLASRCGAGGAGVSVFPTALRANFASSSALRAMSASCLAVTGLALL